jgi:hypothetical protein
MRPRWRVPDAQWTNTGRPRSARSASTAAKVVEPAACSRSHPRRARARAASSTRPSAIQRSSTFHDSAPPRSGCLSPAMAGEASPTPQGRRFELGDEPAPSRAARSATSTPSATTSSPSASARPAPARAGWPWPWRCRPCRPSRSTASSSPGRRWRPASASASCPATSWPRSTRTCAPLRRALRHGRARGRRKRCSSGHRRGGAARVHAGPHAQRQLHHPRRGPEHHARADEDVPHPHRLRLQGRRHRRHHPGRRAGGRQGWGLERILSGIDGPGFVHLGSRDVVRHRIVQDIVDAYECSATTTSTTTRPV